MTRKRLHRPVRLRLAAKFMEGVVILAACNAATAAPALDSAAIAQAGNRRGAAPCSACHGPTGQGNAAAGYPRLAGMDAAYLADQLASFRKGTRSNAVMGPVAKALDDDESKALGRYYASQKPLDEPTRMPREPKMVAAGASLALHGAWNRGLPACAQCHGTLGLGVGVSFPQLAGQAAPYIANQLDSWRVGTRSNDPMGLMHGIAQKLSPAEIQSLANYYASLSAVPPKEKK